MQQRHAMGEESLRGTVLLVLQFLFLALLLWPWSPLALSWPGAILLLAGIAVGLWALSANPFGNFNFRPEVKPEARFITTGPYARIRHPMYTALILFGLGLVLLYADWAKLACWAVLVLVLGMKAVLEEKAMALRFPGYRDYMAMTGRFMPKIMVG